MNHPRTIITAALSVALGAGLVGAAPAGAAPRPVRVSVGVSTSNFTPWADGVTDRAVLRVRLSQRARLKMVVVDARGRTVRKVYLGTVAAGLHRPTWDGRTSAGVLLPTGRYRVSFEAYKKGRRTVTSKRRSVRLQRQRVADRTSTVALDVGTCVNHLRGWPPPTGPNRASARGNPPRCVVGASSMTPVPSWAVWAVRPTDRVAGPMQVRATFDAVYHDNMANGFGYVIDAQPEMDEAPTYFSASSESRPPVYVTPWTEVASLPVDRPLAVVAYAAFPEVMLISRAQVEVRYRGLVPA